MLGPAVVGLVIEHFGLAPAFYLNAVSFVPVFLVLVLLRSHEEKSPLRRAAEPLFRSVLSGLKAITADRLLRAVVLIYALLLFATPSVALLLPLINRERLHGSAALLGTMFSAFSGGTVCGALLAGIARTSRVQILVFAVGLLTWAVALTTVGRITWVVAIIWALLVLGAAQSAISVTALSLLQHRTGETMRARMMSINTVAIMGIRPLGDFPVAILIAGVGIMRATAILASAFLCIALAAGLHASSLEERTVNERPHGGIIWKRKGGCR
jgi:sugar phosphate permease